MPAAPFVDNQLELIFHTIAHRCAMVSEDDILHFFSALKILEPSLGIDICHSALTVSVHTAAVLVYTRENSGVPDVVQLGTGSFRICDLKFFFCNKFSVCTHSLSSILSFLSTDRLIIP